MKRTVILIITVMLVAFSTPISGEEKSIDNQMEVVRLKLENVQLRKSLISIQFKDLHLLEAQLVAQLKELQSQKDEKKKIEKKDTEEE